MGLTGFKQGQSLSSLSQPSTPLEFGSVLAGQTRDSGKTHGTGLQNARACNGHLEGSSILKGLEQFGLVHILCCVWFFASSFPMLHLSEQRQTGRHHRITVQVRGQTRLTTNPMVSASATVVWTSSPPKNTIFQH